MDNIKYDFGDYNTPTKWEDITLKQLQDLEALYDGEDVKVTDLISVLCGKDKDEVDQLPIQFTEKIVEAMAFLQTPIPEQKPTNTITINGEVYKVNTDRQMKTLEAISAQKMIDADKHNYAGVLAIVCRREDEIYDSKFENEILPERIALFETQPAIKVKPLIDFFLRIWLLRTMPTAISSDLREKLEELARDTEILQVDGGISKRSMRSLQKQIKVLQKSLNGIM